MPFWGNPLLQLEYRKEQRTVQWEMGSFEAISAPRLEKWKGEHASCCNGFRSWVGTPGLHTMGDLRRLTVGLTAVKIKWKGFVRHGRPCWLL